MGVVSEPRPPQPLQHHLIGYHHPYSSRRSLPGAVPAGASMSQGFHQGVFSFSDGFDRSVYAPGGQQQQQIAQQSQRDKLMVQGFDPSGGPLMAMEEREEPIYDTAGADNMLSDMFNLPSTGEHLTTELLANQIAASYRLHRPDAAAAGSGFSGDWYGGSGQGVAAGGLTIGSPLQNQLSGLNADSSAAAMQLFLMNPPQQQPQNQQRQQAPKSPSPPSPATQNSQKPHAFQTPFFGSSSTAYGGGAPLEGQGLSLSLSTSLQQLEMAKAKELRMRDAVLYFDNQQHQHQQQQQLQPPPLELQGQPVHHGGSRASFGVVNALRHSRYARASQELLEEFCSVVRGQLKGRGKRPGSSTNPNPRSASDGGGASTSGADAAGTSSSTKEAPPLLPVDRFEQQRRKAKLLSMMDEVDRRYSHYCDQMQMVVNSFDSAMGFEAATPYTALAQRAMSRHFRCLKDAIAAQLKRAYGLLGEKDTVSTSAITKGKTPRLRLLEQSLWRQKGLRQMGMMEQEAWRLQRGLPERSVKILRAWLFEHFLHPYPSDADKHFLARQTGLSRNQVSNWFVNGRVRLWKPMVEEMYQKEEAEAREREGGKAQSPTQQQQRPEINATKGDPPHEMPSPDSRQQQQLFASSDSAPTTLPLARPGHGGGGGGDVAALLGIDALPAGELYSPDGGEGRNARGANMRGYSPAMAGSVASHGRLVASGDVSLTLGLRHAGNVPETGRFPLRQRFEGC